jgi:hypothetical protein
VTEPSCTGVLNVASVSKTILIKSEAKSVFAVFTPTTQNYIISVELTAVLIRIGSLVPNL